MHVQNDLLRYRINQRRNLSTFRQRLPSNQVYYYRSPAHSHHSVLSFAFAFDAEEDGEKYQFALTYPYSYSRCMSMIQRLKRERGDLLRVKTVAKSVVSRYAANPSIDVGTTYYIEVHFLILGRSCVHINTYIDSKVGRFRW